MLRMIWGAIGMNGLSKQSGPIHSIMVNKFDFIVYLEQHI